MADNEDPALSHLLMDRGDPVGNSPDTFARRALHVLVGNAPSQPIPVNASVTLTPGFATLVSGYPKQVPVTPMSSLALPANSSRLFAYLANHTTSAVYIEFGAPAVIGQGIRLLAGATYLVSGGDLWLGDINAISSGSINISVTEATL